MTAAPQEAATPAGCFAAKPDDPIGWCSGHGCLVDRCPAVEVRVLSLLQPWASLWVAGTKGPETRSWGTDYRGLIAVHASKGFERDVRNICTIEPFRSALRELGFANADELPRASVIGAVTVTGCEEMVERSLVPGAGFDISPGSKRLTETERAFGEYRPGRYAWLSGGPRVVLAKPIPMKGSLGLRHLRWDIAAQVLEAIP